MVNAGIGPGRPGGRAVVPLLSTLMVLLLAAGWLLSGRLVGDVPPLAVAAGRTAAGFVTLTVLAVLRPRTWPDVRTGTRRPRAVIVLAFLGFFVYYTGTLLGISRIGASRVGLIVSLLPCVTFLIGIAAYRERSTRRKALGTVLAVAAALGYAGADGTAAAHLANGGALLTGALFAIAGTVAYALYGYVYRQHMADVSPLAVLPAVTGAGTVLLGLAAALFVPLGGLSLADWGGVALLGAVLTAPVFLISHELILRKGPLFTSALALVVPFLVRLGEWTLGWAPPPGPLAVALICLCAAGVWLTVGGGRPAAHEKSPGSGAPVADGPDERDTVRHERGTREHH
ncbi:DMT family transporter [Streptomyces sp. NPDC046557]|uniref:DMT family transporter n=1 Tax=Streptomyces sp. NPDC046557 TaxID=3155372 RepID=UPI00340C2EFD